MLLARAAMRARLRDEPGPDRDEINRLEDGLRNLQILDREHKALAQAGLVRQTDCVTLSSRDHRWLEVSEGICQLLGYPRSELVGRIAKDFVAPELQEKTTAIFSALVRTGSAAGTHTVIRKDGQRVNFEFQSSVFPEGSIITYWYPGAISDMDKRDRNQAQERGASALPGENLPPCSFEI